MNANEVIANRALQHVGRSKEDDGRLHPNEHVHIGLSTNDVYPSALRIATSKGIQQHGPSGSRHGG
jgi:aspartate ammonia-lyase